MQRIPFYLKIILSLASMGYLSYQVRGQDTEVILLGTVHFKSTVTADSIYPVLIRHDPAVLLLEADSSAFDSHFRFRTKKNTSNEKIAVEWFLQKKPHTILRPFDSRGRSHEYYGKNGIAIRENRLRKKIDQLFQKGYFSSPASHLVQEINKLERERMQQEDQGLRVLNSKEAIMREKAYFQLLYVKLPKELEATHLEIATQLSLIKDYWTQVNTKMARNIRASISEFNGKKIMILVGNDHKFWLEELLDSDQQSGSFRWIPPFP